MFRFLSAVVAAAAALATGSIVDCNPTSVFRPTQLALTPDPPVRGQPVTMTVVFNNPGAPVADGKVVSSISLNGIPFSPSTEALCTNTACPIATGVNDRSATSTWPSTVSGKVVSKSEWFSPAGESLLCVQTKATVATPRLRAAGGLYMAPYWGNSTATGSSGSGSPTSGSSSGNSTASGSSSTGTGSKSGGSSSGSGSSSSSGSSNATHYESYLQSSRLVLMQKYVA